MDGGFLGLTKCLVFECKRMDRENPSIFHRCTNNPPRKRYKEDSEVEEVTYLQTIKLPTSIYLRAQ